MVDDFRKLKAAPSVPGSARVQGQGQSRSYGWCLTNNNDKKVFVCVHRQSSDVATTNKSNWGCIGFSSAVQICDDFFPVLELSCPGNGPVCVTSWQASLCTLMESELHDLCFSVAHPQESRGTHHRFGGIWRAGSTLSNQQIDMRRTQQRLFWSITV